YAFESRDRIICAFVEQGIWHLGTIDITQKTLEPIETPFTEISFVQAALGRAVFRAASPTEPFAIIEMNLATRETKSLQRGSNVDIDAGYVSIAQSVEFSTENGLTAHGF